MKPTQSFITIIANLIHWIDKKEIGQVIHLSDFVLNNLL
jgi:hypothetical protein